jgi:excisionase family DNA binding protein
MGKSETGNRKSAIKLKGLRGLLPWGKKQGMMTDIEGRLLKILTANRYQLAAIDRILDRMPEPPRRELRAPVLENIKTAAAFLGVSRATVWRMMKLGRLEQVEILLGTFRVRREDLEALAGYDEDGRVASRSRFRGAVPVVEGL